jgi:predicted Zn-ribbon and HTH transcriptional regulator
MDNGELKDKIKIQVEGYQCYRCGYEWVPRWQDKLPKVCPNCHSPYWDRKRKNQITEMKGGKRK